MLDYSTAYQDHLMQCATGILPSHTMTRPLMVIPRPCETGEHENMISVHYHSPGIWNLTFLNILLISHAYENAQFPVLRPFHMPMKIQESGDES